MVPKKDIAVYGYGSVAWKDRMEDWKKKQNDKLQVVKHEGNNNGGNFDSDDVEEPDFPMQVSNYFVLFIFFNDPIIFMLHDWSVSASL